MFTRKVNRSWHQQRNEPCSCIQIRQKVKMFYGYLQMGQSEDERCEQIHHHLAQLIKKKRTSIGLSGIGNAWSASFDNF